jgi:hypothetical protein
MLLVCHCACTSVFRVLTLYFGDSPNRPDLANFCFAPTKSSSLLSPAPATTCREVDTLKAALRAARSGQPFTPGTLSNSFTAGISNTGIANLNLGPSAGGVLRTPGPSGTTQGSGGGQLSQQQQQQQQGVLSRLSSRGGSTSVGDWVAEREALVAQVRGGGLHVCAV